MNSNKQQPTTTRIPSYHGKHIEWRTYSHDLRTFLITKLPQSAREQVLEALSKAETSTVSPEELSKDSDALLYAYVDETCHGGARSTVSKTKSGITAYCNLKSQAEMNSAARQSRLLDRLQSMYYTGTGPQGVPDFLDRLEEMMAELESAGATLQEYHKMNTVFRAMGQSPYLRDYLRTLKHRQLSSSEIIQELKNDAIDEHLLDEGYQQRVNPGQLENSTPLSTSSILSQTVPTPLLGTTTKPFHKTLVFKTQKRGKRIHGNILAKSKVKCYNCGIRTLRTRLLLTRRRKEQ